MPCFPNKILSALRDAYILDIQGLAHCFSKQPIINILLTILIIIYKLLEIGVNPW